MPLEQLGLHSRWLPVSMQPPGEAARHPAGHVHPLLEPGQVCVLLQGILCPAVPHPGQDLPGTLIRVCLHRGFAGVWKQQ